jgi:prepilin-type N-terminal cleavage/methylation domain-containing protein
MRSVRVSAGKRDGFSLLELMTVVAIVGVLSAVAIPTFSNYIYKSRTAEATEFLGVIRLREESYRAEFGVYCPTIDPNSAPNSVSSLGTHGNLVPNPDSSRRNAVAFTSTTPWLQLGARPTGPVRFGYGVAAGVPADAPSSLGWNTANSDFWFVARAVGDLDADNTFATFEIYSPTKNIWIGDASGNALDKGWE